MANFHTIETGYFWADGGAMFGPIPKKYWQKKYPCNENNMCRMSMRSLFIELDDRKIVIDCGAGDKHLNKLKFYAPHHLKDLREEIQTIGYAASEVTDVILTHLHFDHCGGGTVFDENRNCVPAFPNARYWLSRAQWENYQKPRLYEESSFFAENIDPVFEAGLLHFVEEDTRLTPEVSMHLFNGHTPGQIVVFIELNNRRVVFAGDVIPASTHISPGWLSAYDNDAALAMEEKMRLLDWIKQRGGAEIIFPHDAHTPKKSV